MTSMVVQFHATPEEILEFIKSVTLDLRLTLTLVRFKPFFLKELESREIQRLNDLSSADLGVSYLLSQQPLNLEANSKNMTLELNPGCVIVEVGKMTEFALHESCLSFVSEDHEEIGTAKKVTSRLKKITRAGVDVVNSESGATGRIRSHRYSEGARIKCKEGLKLIPLSGSNYIRIPE